MAAKVTEKSLRRVGGKEAHGWLHSSLWSSRHLWSLSKELAIIEEPSLRSSMVSNREFMMMKFLKYFSENYSSKTKSIFLEKIHIVESYC